MLAYARATCGERFYEKKSQKSTALVLISLVSCRSDGLANS
jgi:hypothetical protein